MKMLEMNRERLALEDFAGLDAGRANANALANTVHNSLDRLQVWVPATARDVVRVRDVISELRTFAANITYLCHDKTLRKSKLCACLRMPHAKQPGSGNRNPQTSADLFLRRRIREEKD